ncbi:MAG: SusC/RagA family TonB-linked outer membrane protein [Cytophagales bacterium]|nr:SusC/RagA family TonB-linked outer membrane protein [Cytophagales bacterium]
MQALWGQERVITGRVSSAEDGAAIPGVNVVVKGATQGTVTDANGNYRISVSQEAKFLLFSSVGFIRQEVEIGNRTTIDVVLQVDTRQLEEVVVTALGLTQQKKTLTYSVQEVKSTEILQSREANIVNALNSKVAGVQVISNAGTPGAGAAIYIRGKNSFTGPSQPLFVVDGVPINNAFRGGSGAGVDIPNRAIDINPDDIESISVLKGPAAAALYGIQGGSGVVLITTKKGAKGERRTTNIHFSTSYSLERINKMFQLQTEYAQGSGGVFSDAPTQTFLFGPRLSELRYNGIPDVLSPLGRIVPATDPTARQDLPVLPFDNQGNFWQTGTTWNNYFSLQSGNKDGNLFFSLGHLDQKGIIPNNTFSRTSAKLAGESALGEKFRMSSSITYTRSGGNRVGRGDNFTGVVQGLYRTPVHFDIFNGQRDPRNPIAYKFPNGAQRNFRNRNQIDGMNPADLGLGPDSPLWTVNENSFVDDVHRINGYFQLNGQILSWLKAMWRGGIDMFSDNRTATFNIGSFGADGRYGRVFEDTYLDRTFNSDFILTAEYAIGNINTRLLIGHNHFATQSTFRRIDGNTFNQPDFYNISNATVYANPQQSLTRRATYAVFASFKADYKDMIFLELTGRNEWASTLPKNNNSFFFPSASLSASLTDMLGFQDNPTFSLAKVRLSYATAAQIPAAYSTETFYFRASAVNGFGNGISFPIQGSNIGGVTLGNTLGNPDLKPETNSTLELGTNLHFLSDRITIDVTYYNSLSKNLLTPLQIAPSSGFTTRNVNAGEVRNRGIEIVLAMTPIKQSNLRWDITFNFTRNRNVVVSLPEGLAFINLPGFGTIFTPRLVPGQEFGVFYGTGWLRDEQGRRIIGDNGFPIRQDNILIGNPNPRYLLGIRNAISWKGVSLSFLFDIRKGGDVWNGTEAVLTNIGATVRTLQRGQQVVFEGVRRDGTPNTQPVTLTQQNWFQQDGRATGAAGVHEQFVEDASWVRLRDASLSYALPKAIAQKLKMKSLEVSLFGRNLWLLTNYSGIDPETNLYGISPAQGLDYFGNPNTRSVGVSLNASF